MPKIKIKEFKGIYSNVDENDLRLDIFKDSVNFRHEQGYASFELPYLKGYTLPNVNNYLTGWTGWQWETGTFVTLTNDPFNMESKVAHKYNILFLVAKKVVNNITHRLFWFQEYPNGTWYELSKYSEALPLNTTLDLINQTKSENNYSFNNSLISTSEEGQVFFKNERGILKIYLPHDCFWFGRLERSQTGAHWSGEPPIKITWNQFYIDRLTEPFNKDNLGTDYLTIIDPTTGGHIRQMEFPTCTPTRRLGYSYVLTLADTSTIRVKEVKVKWTYLGLDNGTRSWQYWKYKLTDQETNQAYQRPRESFDLSFAGLPGEPVLQDFLPDDSTMHIFPYSAISNKELAVFPEYADLLERADGVAFASIFPNTYSTISLVESTGVNPAYDLKLNQPHGSYGIEKVLFDGYSNDFRLKKGYTISEQGFSKATQSKFWLVFTQVLDEQEEIIVKTDRGEYTGNESKYSLKFVNAFPTRDGNRRLTRTRIYIKFNEDSDYEMVKDFQYLDEKTIDPANFYISNLDLSNIYLSQNIGYFFDEKYPQNYKIITGFRSATNENGIGLGIDTNDYINVYHSTVGGGNLQTNLILSSNLLPLKNISYVNSLVGVNGNILVITEQATHVIKADTVSNTIGFTILETLEIGTKNVFDTAVTNNQAILNTINGIVITDGFQKKIISEPINDVIKANYTNSRIVYNSILHELYYIPDWGTSNYYYRYRFEVNKWEKRQIGES